MLVHAVAIHGLEGPGSAAGGGGQTHLLYVDREHRELRRGQAAYNTLVSSGLGHFYFVRNTRSERSCNCLIKRKICDQGNYFLSDVTLSYTACHKQVNNFPLIRQIVRL